jgi:ArsR family transcriptional regulator, arsenate/arsenite/antimonite-responsive transcriptional repressor
MNAADAIEALAALAQESRLAVYRTLVRAGETGFAVGEIAERLNIPAATLSFHLKELARAKLIVTEQRGRSIQCTVHFQTMHRLLGYLQENCCVEQSPASADCCPATTAVVAPSKTADPKPKRQSAKTVASTKRKSS